MGPCVCCVCVCFERGRERERGSTIGRYVQVCVHVCQSACVYHTWAPIALTDVMAVNAKGVANGRSSRRTLMRKTAPTTRRGICLFLVLLLCRGMGGSRDVRGVWAGRSRARAVSVVGRSSEWASVCMHVCVCVCTYLERRVDVAQVVGEGEGPIACHAKHSTGCHGHRRDACVWIDVCVAGVEVWVSGERRERGVCSYVSMSECVRMLCAAYRPERRSRRGR